jgi:hypothetical protein
MLAPLEISRLAQLYATATGISLSTLGRRACRNNRVFLRLQKGEGAHVKTLMRIETFFRATWPDNVTWPVDIVPGLAERRRRLRPINGSEVSEGTS